MANYDREQMLKALAGAQKAGDRDAVRALASEIERMDQAANIDPNVMVESAERRQEEAPWMKEAAKRGPIAALAGPSALVDALSYQIAESVGLEEDDNLTFMERMGQTYANNTEAANMLFEDIGTYTEDKLGVNLGYESSGYTQAELRQADPTGGVASAGIEAATDPTSYVGAPAKALPIAVRGVESFFSGLLADLGGKTAETAGLGEGGQMAAAIVAGGAVPTMTGGAREATTKKAVDYGKEFVKEYKELSKTGRVANNLLKDAAEIETADLDKVVANFKEIGDIIGVDEFPIMVQLADNPVLLQRYQESIARNPQLKQQLQQEMDKLSAKIVEKGDLLFGEQNVPDFSQSTINPEVVRQQSVAEKAVTVLGDKINAKATELDAPLTSSQVGTQLQKLVEQREKAARAAMDGEYEAIKVMGREAGIRLPQDAAKTLHDFVRSNKLTDLFGKGTETERVVNRILKPRKRTTNAGNIELSYKNLSFDDVVSLKNRINDEIRSARKAGDANAVRRLEQFKEVFNNTRSRYLPAEFDELLRETDQLYYQKIGLPFNNKTIRDMDSKAYAEQVAPILMRPSAAKQFVETMGEETAHPVIKNAVMADLYKKAVRPDGTINQSRLEAEIKRNAETIGLVPGLREQLDLTAQSNGELLREYKAAKDQLSEQAKNTAAAQKLMENPQLNVTFKNVARDLSNGNNFTKFKDQISMFDDATQNVLMNRLRREIWANATNSSGGALKALTDPNNRPVLDMMFGREYVTNLQAVANLSDQLSKVDPAKIDLRMKADDLDPVQRATGTTKESMFSTLRSKVMSPLQKVFVILSKANSGRAKAASEKEIEQLFLDPNTIKRMAALSKKHNGKINEKTAPGILEEFRVAMGSRVVGLNMSAYNRELSRQAAQDEQEQQGPLQVEVTQGQR